MARQADVNRGWGNFCSKSCKAAKQEKQTGQYARFLSRGGGEDGIDYEGGGFFDYKDISGNTGYLDAH